MATASEGVVACSTGERTRHRLAGIGSGEAALQMCYEIALRPTSTSIWRKWGLVIDEISMVDGDYFEVSWFGGEVHSNELV